MYLDTCLTKLILNKKLIMDKINFNVTWFICGYFYNRSKME